MELPFDLKTIHPKIANQMAVGNGFMGDEFNMGINLLQAINAKLIAQGWKLTEMTVFCPGLKKGTVLLEEKIFKKGTFVREITF